MYGQLCNDILTSFLHSQVISTGVDRSSYILLRIEYKLVFWFSNLCLSVSGEDPSEEPPMFYAISSVVTVVLLAVASHTFTDSFSTHLLLLVPTTACMAD